MATNLNPAQQLEADRRWAVVEDLDAFASSMKSGFPAGSFIVRDAERRLGCAQDDYSRFVRACEAWKGQAPTWINPLDSIREGI